MSNKETNHPRKAVNGTDKRGIYRLVSGVLAAWSMAAFSANATLVSSPFKGTLTVSSIQPAVERSIYVDGAKTGDIHTAAAGERLLFLSYIPKTLAPSIEVTSDISLTTGDSTLNLKSGDRVVPDTRLLDAAGRSYYLVLTDPQTSSFFKKSRYFGLAENGEVLDRAFSPLSDTYLTREEVKITGGSFNVKRDEKSGSKQCSLSTVYLGQAEGTLKFKLIRSDARGAVDTEQVRSFAAGVKSISLPGSQLTITKADTKSIKVRVDGLPPINCRDAL